MPLHFCEVNNSSGTVQISPITDKLAQAGGGRLTSVFHIDVKLLNNVLATLQEFFVLHRMQTG